MSFSIILECSSSAVTLIVSACWGWECHCLKVGHSSLRLHHHASLLSVTYILKKPNSYKVCSTYNWRRLKYSVIGESLFTGGSDSPDHGTVIDICRFLRTRRHHPSAFAAISGTALFSFQLFINLSLTMWSKPLVPKTIGSMHLTCPMYPLIMYNLLSFSSFLNSLITTDTSSRRLFCSVCNRMTVPETSCWYSHWKIILKN